MENITYDFDIILFAYSGYMSPEYAMHGHFSVKSDVFSFGVIVLEIVGGRRNSSFYQQNEVEDLLRFVSNLMCFHELEATISTKIYSRLSCFHLCVCSISN